MLPHDESVDISAFLHMISSVFSLLAAMREHTKNRSLSLCVKEGRKRKKKKKEDDDEDNEREEIAGRIKTRTR